MSDEKKGTAARLRELLDRKDAQLHKAQERIGLLEREKDYGLGWALPEVLDLPQELPVPRVEANYAPDRSAGWRRTSCYVRVVLPERSWGAVGSPTVVQAHAIGGGRSDGGREEPPSLDADPMALPLTHVHRTAEHLSAVLGIPGFLVVEGVGSRPLPRGTNACVCAACLPAHLEHCSCFGHRPAAPGKARSRKCFSKPGWWQTLCGADAANQGFGWSNEPAGVGCAACLLLVERGYGASRQPAEHMVPARDKDAVLAARREARGGT